MDNHDNKKLLSAIIVTYNSSNDIFDCIDSVYKYNDIGSLLEIIIVDNNSTDFDIMSKELKTHYNDSIKLIRNTRNGGYGQGNNIGIKASSSPYFIIINPDVRLMMPIFKSTIETLSVSGNVMCGYRMMENENEQGISFFYTHTTCGIKKRLFARKTHNINRYDQKNMFIAGACFAMTKDAFTTIGMFDENIFLYGEENDIHYRLHKYLPDSNIVFLKELKYIHPVFDRTITDETWRRVLESRIYFYKKNNLPIHRLYWNEISQIYLNEIILFVLHHSEYNNQKKTIQQKKNLFRNIFKGIHS